ncbi:MAG TPA: response regulator [Pirellulaceae bacterium]|jgi:PAS domain S-box-containing protein
MSEEPPIRVLLVEDSPTDVLLAEEALASKRFRMQSTERLGDALKLLSTREYDVVLLDLGLPDSQGLGTLRTLRRDHPDIAIVVLTGRDDEELALQALKEGAQDYLVKGQKENEALGRAIRYAIERREAEEARQERAAISSVNADVGLAFTTGGALPDMLQRCADSMVRNLGGAFARIWTLNRPENVLELVASAGMYTHIDGPHARVPVGKYKIGLIAEERKPHLTNNVAVDPRISDPEWAKREGMVAFAGYPLVLEDRLVGVMGMFARRPLSDTTIEAMASVANQIALGIERKLKEEALSASEALLTELTAHVHQVLWVIDARESKVLYVSPAYEPMWGRSCQSLIDNPRSYMEGIHPLDYDMMLRANADMFRTGYIDVETRVQRPEGSVRWVWIRGYPVLEQGQIVRLVGVIEDITEKRQLASERDALLARLQLHIERLPLAYILMDAEFHIIDWNPCAERIFGFSKDEILGNGPPFEKFVPPSFQQSGEELLTRIRSGDMQAHSTNDNLTKDGRTIACDWFNTPLLDDNGNFTGLLCLAQDVTARKAMESQLQQAQKMEVVGHLAGGVAHDFNNLLAVILGCCQFLENDATLTADSHELVEEIYKAGTRAAALTKQLLAFSRRQILQPKLLNLNEVVTETVVMLDRLIGEDIELKTNLYARLWPVKVDAGQMNQVIMNLAVNARDAMREGGTLIIQTTNTELDESYAQCHPQVKAGPYVSLAITDTGCGMDEQTKARMFEPFFTTKETGKGTGLGLATVFGIVKQSGGHVTVYSEIGKGTTFRVYLPKEETATDAGREKKSPPAPPRGTETVLVVEDEKMMRNLACRTLQSQGYMVLSARDGENAIEVYKLHTGSIQLVLTDVVMPKMGGRQLYDQLRALQPDLKVLFMSGYTDDAVLRHGVLEAETNFIEKPFTYAALASAVRKVLDSPSLTEQAS